MSCDHEVANEWESYGGKKTPAIFNNNSHLQGFEFVNSNRHIITEDSV